MLVLTKHCKNCELNSRSKEERNVIRVECDALGGTLLIFPINEARCSRYTPRAFTQEEEIQDLRLEIKALKKQLADKKPTNKSKKK